MRRISIIIMVFLFFTTMNVVFADSENNADKIKVKSTASSLEISWDIGSRNVQLIELNEENEKVVYSGKARKKLIEGLTEDTLYKYKLNAYDDQGNFVEEYFVSSQTKKKKAPDPSNVDLDSTVVLYKKNVKLEWTEIAKVTEYKIYKNNKLVATVNKNKYIDDEELTERYNIYEIQFSIPLSEDEKKHLEKDFNHAGISITQEEIDRFSRSYSIIKVVDSSPFLDEVYAAGIAKSFKWWYKTFIPAAYAEDPWYNVGTWGTSIKYFGGDNRGFSATSDIYRTKTLGDSIFYDDGTATSEAFFKNVAPTKAYNASYQLVGTQTATDQYLNRIVNSKTSTMVDVTVYHKVGNPYAVQGAEIDYNLRAKTYKNGSYTFEGIHDRAPSHELYLRISNGTTLTIYTHTNEGFSYLAAPSTYAKTFVVSG